jgi:hypothetical protein
MGQTLQATSGVNRTQPTIPVRGQARPWEGTIDRKPDEYAVTAIIPTLDPGDEVRLVVELLRRQTLRPYILLIDTGSGPEATKRLEALAAPDVEVHSLRFNAVKHPSEPVSIALDFGAARCQTRLSFYTHTDCFLMSQDVIENMAAELSEESPVTGYQLTPRAHADWAEHYGHTCLLADQDLLHRYGISWNMRRCALYHGLLDYGVTPDRPNWPDTEIPFNAQLKYYGFVPKFLGGEDNYLRNIRPPHFDHVRSISSANLYSPDHKAKSAGWLVSAMADAEARLRAWDAAPRAEVFINPPPLPVVMQLPEFKSAPDVSPLPSEVRRRPPAPAAAPVPAPNQPEGLSPRSVFYQGF